jgi:hypothetical protein
MEQTVAEQIHTLITNLREDVTNAQDKLNAAKIALADALAAFKPGQIGRPPGAAKVRKTKKPKQVAEIPVVVTE